MSLPQLTVRRYSYKSATRLCCNKGVRLRVVDSNASAIILKHRPLRVDITTVSQPPPCAGHRAPTEWYARCSAPGASSRKAVGVISAVKKAKGVGGPVPVGKWPPARVKSRAWLPPALPPSPPSRQQGAERSTSGALLPRYGEAKVAKSRHRQQGAGQYCWFHVYTGLPQGSRSRYFFTVILLSMG